MKDDYIVIYAVVPKYIYETKQLTCKSQYKNVGKVENKNVGLM